MGSKNFSDFTLPLLCLLILSPLTHCQLDYIFYDYSCPNLTRMVRNGLFQAIHNETKIAASPLRMYFHDWDVMDRSFLTMPLTSPVRRVRPNINSVRGFEVIDIIKANVERACPSTVSCADILSLAASEAVFLSGGPYWSTPLGRRDGKTVNKTAANELPSPFEPLEKITAKFVAKGLSVKDVVLSGPLLDTNHCYKILWTNITVRPDMNPIVILGSSASQGVTLWEIFTKPK